MGDVCVHIFTHTPCVYTDTISALWNFASGQSRANTRMFWSMSIVGGRKVSRHTFPGFRTCVFFSGAIGRHYCVDPGPLGLQNGRHKQTAKTQSQQLLCFPFSFRVAARPLKEIRVEPTCKPWPSTFGRGFLYSVHLRNKLRISAKLDIKKNLVQPLSSSWAEVDDCKAPLRP